MRTGTPRNDARPRLVTVMMPAYNAAGFIGEAIDSVLAQSYANWELIVVNDGSTDATAGIVARYDDPRIRLITQPNGGESSARNNVRGDGENLTECTGEGGAAGSRALDKIIAWNVHSEAASSSL
jgi:glycosyltransferase involved in cell wall biosynthesis